MEFGMIPTVGAVYDRAFVHDFTVGATDLLEMKIHRDACVLIWNENGPFPVAETTDEIIFGSGTSLWRAIGRVLTGTRSFKLCAISSGSSASVDCVLASEINCGSHCAEK